MTISRIWAMPNADTFDVQPIGEFVRRFLGQSRVSVDPFARNKRWATHTNDLNPNTAAEHHMYAQEFLDHLVSQQVIADLIILDPPYSPRQIKECYDSIGIKMAQEDAMLGCSRKKLRESINHLTQPGAICLNFGWNTVGMCKGWEIIEILMVCHGSDHNDTICMASRKLPELPPELPNPQQFLNLV